jgi:hypothetical protein
VTPESDAAIPHGLIERSSDQADKRATFGGATPSPNSWLICNSMALCFTAYSTLLECEPLNSTPVSSNLVRTEAPEASKPSERCTSFSGFSSQSSIRNSLSYSGADEQPFGVPDPEGSPSVRSFEFVCRDLSLSSRRIAYRERAWLEKATDDEYAPRLLNSLSSMLRPLVPRPARTR